jgi:hypothetical protein
LKEIPAVQHQELSDIWMYRWQTWSVKSVEAN